MNSLDFWSICKGSSDACWSKKNTDAMVQIVWAFIITFFASLYAIYGYKNSPSTPNIIFYAVMSVSLCIIVLNVFLINIIDLHINAKQTLGTFKEVIFSSKMIRALLAEVIAALVLIILIYSTTTINDWLPAYSVTPQNTPQISFNYLFTIMFIIIDFQINLVIIINILLFIPAMILGKNTFIYLNINDSATILTSLMLVIVNKMRWIILASIYMIGFSKYSIFTEQLIFSGSAMAFPITLTTIIIAYKQLLTTDRIIKLYK